MMTPEKARKLAEEALTSAKLLFAYDQLVEVSRFILVACTDEAEDVEARLAAERRRIARLVGSRTDYRTYGEVEELVKSILALNPADALAEHDRLVRLEEAEWWANRQK